MIRVILESQNRQAIAIEHLQDTFYECVKGFLVLGNLDNCSYDCFSKTDMPKVIRELKIIKKQKSEQLSLDRVIKLAERCHNGEGFCLTFTPFVD